MEVYGQQALKLQDRGHRHAHGVAQGHAIQMTVEAPNYNIKD